MIQAQPAPQAGDRIDRERRGWAPRWWVVFLSGLALWIASIIVTRVTRNLNMIPTVVLLGSFLVPVTAVVWYVDHDPSPLLGPRRIFDAFAVGGLIGVLAVSLVEFWLLTLGLLGAWAVLAIYTVARDFDVGTPVVAGLCAIAAYIVGSDAIIRQMKSFRA